MFSYYRMRISSVDLYQIHGPGLQSDGTEIGQALAEAVKSGRCRAVGVSNYALDEMMPVYAALEKQGIPLASNQVTECVLLLQNVFFYYRMCSLTTECVLLLHPASLQPGASN